MRKSTTVHEDHHNNNNPVSPGLNGRQQSGGSYSSIVGSLQAQNGGEARTTRGDNPFKYGKDEMMHVYSSMVSGNDKINHAPLDFERYEQVTSSMPVQPVSMNGLTEDEHALLAGNINSEQKPRRTEQNDVRSNGNSRRDNRQNGTRDSKKQEASRKNDDDAAQKTSNAHVNGRMPNEVDESSSRPETGVHESSAELGSEPSRENFSQPAGRNTSRLTGMGVFDTAADVETSAKWQDEKDEDVLKEAMGYANSSKQDIDRLAEMYQHQSLGSSAVQSNSQTSRSFGEQAYNPLANGLPDLFSKTPNPSASFSQASQQAPPRGAFMEQVPSPGLQMRQDQPMTARVMVMPDKLKWQYRDPTGQNQGPFSGLEMHDWYKAGFFQPNLLVKREEDEDFEPLSILVRRIGNQREPFLVPLPSRVTASTQTARPGSQDGKEQWPNGQNWSGGGQPPFPQSFPSFGTTLTAEQQNALERRKQEEQYLMHRQREFLQQQQMAQQMAAQRLLHHQNPYAHGGGGGGGGQSFGYGNGMDRRGSPFSSGSERQGSMNSFDMAAGGGGHTGWGGYAPQNQNAQRGQYTDFGAGIFDTPKSEMADQTYREPERVVEHSAHDEFTKSKGQDQNQSAINNLTHQKFHQSDYASRMAQQAQAAQRQAEAIKRSAALVEPPQETPHISGRESPIPVEPQEQIQAQVSQASLEEERHESSGPASDYTSNAPEAPSTPSAAPWAAAASTKGKSLREIQEVEAKRDALRRQVERKAASEALAQAEANALQAAPAIVTVPLNWAADSIGDQQSPSQSGAAAWKSSSASGKKTLAQIQQEEEAARRAKAAAQAKALAQVQVNGARAPATFGAKYAETAMKPSGTWATVGSGGKVSAPIQRVDQRPPVGVTAPVTKPRVVSVPVTPIATTRPSDPDAISPEFLNWARTALKGLNPGVNFAEFLQLLLSFGTDGGKDTREIISDSIYANSATMDGRRFADEWSKRRKEDLKNTNGQNKSISELTSTLASSSASTNSNGWSDVVKTKPGKQDTEEEWNTSFKVQAKKGGKRK